MMTILRSTPSDFILTEFNDHLNQVIKSRQEPFQRTDLTKPSILFVIAAFRTLQGDIILKRHGTIHRDTIETLNTLDIIRQVSRQEDIDLDSHWWIPKIDQVPYEHDGTFGFNYTAKDAILIPIDEVQDITIIPRKFDIKI